MVKISGTEKFNFSFLFSFLFIDFFLRGGDFVIYQRMLTSAIEQFNEWAFLQLNKLWYFGSGRWIMWKMDLNKLIVSDWSLSGVIGGRWYKAPLHPDTEIPKWEKEERYKGVKKWNIAFVSGSSQQIW